MLDGGQGSFPFNANFGARIDFNARPLDGDPNNYPMQVKLVNSTIPLLTDLLLDPSIGKACINGGGDLRFSFDPKGLIRLAVAVIQCVVDANPSNRKLELIIGTNAPFYSNPIYIWWGITGGVQPAETSIYGAKYAGVMYSANYNTCYANGQDVDDGMFNKVKDYSILATRTDWIKYDSNRPIEIAGPLFPIKAQQHTGGDYYYQPYSAKLGASSIVSVDGWFRWDDVSISGTPVIFSNKQTRADLNGFEIFLGSTPNEIHINLSDGSIITQVIPFNWTDNEYHYILFDYYGSGYVGLTVDTFNYTFFPVADYINNANNFVVGQNTLFNASNFNGSTFGVRMVNTNVVFNLEKFQYRMIKDPTLNILNFTVL
jgi:hypothetical protein